VTNVFAVLGEILFDVLTSPEGFRAQSEYHYAEHQVVEAPPRLQWMADGLQKISLDLGFHVAFTSPILQMTLLRVAAEDHQARALVFGNGTFRGYFVIEAIEETLQQTADDGSYVAISARVELREWVPGADFDPSSPPRRTTPPPGIISSTAAGTLPQSSIVTLSSGATASYSPTPYSSPGVSGIAGSGPGAALPGNPGDVPTSTIVRAG
jgi:phage protein U